MSHLEEYNQIINFRKSNPLPNGQYGENHHIVPKSICSILKDSPDNIVRLSAQEHFLAHYHLWLAYRDELKEKTWAKKMCFAFTQMKRLLIKCNDIVVMSKLYEKVRFELSKIQKGIPKSTTQRMKQSKTMTGRKSPRKGCRLSKETKEKIRFSLKGRGCGRKLSTKTKQKMSNALIGNKHGKGGKATKDFHWFNNGIKSVMAKSCPVGFVKGRLML